MTWGDLLKDVLDKGTIAILVVVVTWYVNTTLEKHKMRLVYRQKLAERTLQAYWEIGGILQEQAFQIQQFIQAVGRLLVDKTETASKELSAAWAEIARSYSSDQPKLLQNLMFVSKDVVDRITSHQRLIKDFTRKANPLKDEDVSSVRAFTAEMAKSIAMVQSKMMEEIREPPNLS